ncbi:MAG: aminopeptidase [Clostridia bacterium]|nr:aminopeptidase [Clostridia bacterium]
MEVNNKWLCYNEEQKNLAYEFCEGYKDFLSNSKTERESIKNAIALAEANGFRNINDLIKNNEKLNPGDKVYAINMNKAIVLFVIGEEAFEKGLNIVGAHIDSPRLDLKCNPIYENSGFCLLDTHYYGGIKKYQWVTTPLALHGIVCKKDGTKIDFVIGENEDDPVFAITDLLPHLDKDKQNRKEVIEGEELDLIVGNIPDKDEKENPIAKNIMNLLNELGIEEDDFLSAEIEVVPSGRARDFGLDRSMILGYGHDDRSCAYSSLKAILGVKNPKRTAVCLLVDKEEIGSVGATGMKSKFFENMVAEVMNLFEGYQELKFKRCLNHSCMISSDVTAGYDPVWPAPMNKKTEAFLSRGISFNKFTGHRGKSEANDANPEFIARLRKICEDNKILFQFNEMGKVDAGGGGTIAYILAEYGMEVIDAGIPLLSMHAPWEVASKLDIYESYRFYDVFLNSFE